MKIIHWILMHYYDFRLDASRDDEKRYYYFNRFMFYATKIHKGKW